MSSGARYDGIADWYDTEFQPAPLESETWSIVGRLLGEPCGSLLDVGCGTGSYTAALAERGWDVTGVDVSEDMLRRAQDRGVRTVRADGASLPFGDASFDVMFTAFGAVPFVADSAAIMAEAARVVRPGGRWVFATTHPIRWSFPDDPGPDGLTATMTYWDRTPYVEFADDGTPTYVEHHRTLGDRVREIAAAGLRLVDVVEPEWPDGRTTVWGQWSPLRGALFPGTAIFVCRRP